MAVNHLCQNQRNITQPGRCGGAVGRRKWNAWGTGRLIPSAALTSGIHLLVLFLNLIHLAAQQTGVACWKGFTCVMDAIVRNAKVNIRCSSKKKKKKGRTFLFQVLPMYHHLCNLTLLPSVITFRGRTTAGCVLMGWRWSLKRVTAPQRRGPCHSWQYAGVLLTVRRIWKWSCTVWHECCGTITSWFEHPNRGATLWTSRFLYKSN